MSNFRLWRQKTTRKARSGRQSPPCIEPLERRDLLSTLWGSSILPEVASVHDTAAVEVGVKFQSDVDGYVTGVRFYKGAANTGEHIGHLWTSTGQLLATATFHDETGSGWQQADFNN